MSSTEKHQAARDRDQSIEPGRMLQQLPSIDSILQSPDATQLEGTYGRTLLVEALRTLVGEYRQIIQDGGTEVPTVDSILKACNRWLGDLVAPSLVPMINATGVVVHTNLGRAPLSQPAARAVAEIAVSYSNLEYDERDGKRGSRTIHAEKLILRLTGAEAALVVNNNAAAVLLMLSALCRDREVIISRSQLIEIGGGFRIPDVMAQSGARLVEVGTTNRTHLSDYSKAITEETAAIFVAHHSNFKIVGFTKEPKLAEIASLASDNNLFSLYDQGSGAFLDTSRYGLDEEPTVGAGLLSGADIVAFSGDKLLGGPQAGILCGRSDLIDQIRRHPLARAVRVDKMVLAALTSTLKPYLTGNTTTEIPIWQMISMPVSEIQIRAKRWQDILISQGVKADVIDGLSTIGGGSLPGATIATSLLAIDHEFVSELASALRSCRPAVITRIADGRLLFDPRTVFVDQDDLLLQSVTASIDLIEQAKKK